MTDDLFGKSVYNVIVLLSVVQHEESTLTGLCGNKNFVYTFIGVCILEVCYALSTPLLECVFLKCVTLCLHLYRSVYS